MASKISIGAKTKLPAPCGDLYRAMATAGHAASVDASGREKCTPFLSLPSDVQDHWIAIARSMYAIVAIAGGAVVGTINEPSD